MRTPVVTVADVPRTRFVSWGVIALVAASAGLIAGTAGWATSDKQPDAGHPTASPEPSASPHVIDARLADAPRMTDAAWDQLDETWDVLVVSLPGVESAPRPRGGYAVYLTPPGGERMLAFDRDGLDDSLVTPVGWDPATGFMLLTTPGNSFRVAQMRNGDYAEIASPVAEDLQGVSGLGRASDGFLRVALEVEEDGNVEQLIGSWRGSGWESVVDGGYDSVGTLSGDTLIGTRDGRTYAYDVVTGVESAPIPGLEECVFGTWATETDFSMLCGVERDGIGNVVAANIDGSGVENLGPQVGFGDYGDGVQWIPATPIAFRGNDDALGSEVVVLARQGAQPAGTVPNNGFKYGVTHVEGGRWLIKPEAGFPYVLDAERGTLDYSGEGFGESTAIVTFLAGVRE